MRAWLVVIAAAALVLAGAASARDPKEPQQRHTAADTKRARAIVLRRADLVAGWKAAPKQKDPPPCSVEPDESSLVQTARVDPTFLWKDGITSVGSEVDVFKTAAMAERDWRLSTLGLVRTCLLEAARRTLGKDVKVSLVSARALPPPKVAKRSLHYRLVFRLRGQVDVPVVTDLVGFGEGRTTVVLHTFSVRTPLPATALSQLTSMLANRLVSASGGI